MPATPAAAVRAPGAPDPYGRGQHPGIARYKNPNFVCCKGIRRCSVTGCRGGTVGLCPAARPVDVIDPCGQTGVHIPLLKNPQVRLVGFHIR